VSDLEHELSILAGELEYPPTPDVAPAVRVRIAGAPRRRRPRLRRATAAIAVAGLLLAAGALAAAPGIRHSVLDWLGVDAVRIHRIPALPALPPGAGRDLGLGHRTTLDAARTYVSFPVLVPAGRPDAIYVAGSPPGGQVAFVYRPRRGIPRAPGTGVGLLIAEFRGRQPRAYIDKSLAPGTTVEGVRVGGGRGVWISGTPHQFAYLDARGQPRAQTLRLAGNTLLWRRGAVFLRLEAKVPERRALRIARSLRPAGT
jgi:hypothetical protein